MVWGIWGGRGKRESVWLIQREKVRPLSQWAAGLIVVANKVGRCKGRCESRRPGTYVRYVDVDVVWQAGR